MLEASQIQETKDYTKFKFLPYNRPVSSALVKAHINSLSTRNMLHIYPITVNKKFEIVDGQHRFMACKSLGIPVVYRVIDNMTHEDMITLNTAKAWAIGDYFNYHLKLGNENYFKLDRFMKDNGITLRIALQLLGVANVATKMEEFRKGEFHFFKAEDIQELKIVKQSIEILKQQHGNQFFTKTGKFWKSLLFLIRAPEFNEEHWYKNLRKMTSRVVAQVTTREYLKLFIAIYNHYAPQKISIEKFDDFDGKY